MHSDRWYLDKCELACWISKNMCDMLDEWYRFQMTLVKFFRSDWCFSADWLFDPLFFLDLAPTCLNLTIWSYDDMKCQMSKWTLFTFFFFFFKQISYVLCIILFPILKEKCFYNFIWSIITFSPSEVTFLLMSSRPCGCGKIIA